MNKKILYSILFILAIIVILVIIIYLGIGFHSCYKYSEDLQKEGLLCDKNFMKTGTQSEFDLNSGILKLKQMKYFGIYKTSCGILPFSGCSTNVIPWITFYDKWIEGSKNCKITKIGYLQDTNSDIVPGIDYETKNNSRYSVFYQVKCDYISNIYGNIWYENINKTLLVKNGYTLPEEFNQEIEITPRN